MVVNGRQESYSSLLLPQARGVAVANRRMGERSSIDKCGDQRAKQQERDSTIVGQLARTHVRWRCEKEMSVASKFGSAMLALLLLLPLLRSLERQ